MQMAPRSPGADLKEISSGSVTVAVGGGLLLAATLLLSSVLSRSMYGFTLWDCGVGLEGSGFGLFVLVLRPPWSKLP